MKAIIFNTEAEGIARAEQEGRDSNFPFYTAGGVTQYRTLPIPTNNNKWALVVDDYEHLSPEDSIVDITESDFLQPEESDD